jgi:hypothetical protein
MRGIKTNRTASVVIRGHAVIQNLRRGHYELAVDAGPLPGWPPRSTNSDPPSDQRGPTSRLGMARDQTTQQSPKVLHPHHGAHGVSGQTEEQPLLSFHRCDTKQTLNDRPASRNSFPLHLRD